MHWLVRATTVLLFATNAFAQSEISETRGYVQSLNLADEEPQVAWTYVSRNGKRPIGLSNVCLCDGVVYVGDDPGVLRAFRSSDGELLWEHDHGERIYRAPVCDGTRVYFSNEKWVEAVSCENGESVWKKPIFRGGGTSLWPPRDPGKNKIQMLYVAGGDGVMYGYLAWNGVRRWRGTLMDDVPEDPDGFDGDRARFDDAAARPYGVATDGRTVYQAVFDQCRVIAFNATSGDMLWSFATDGWVGSTPTVDGDDVLIGSQDKKVYCVNKQTGEKKWEFATGSRVSAAPVARGDRVFASSCDGHMYCLDRTTGKEVWKYADPDEPRSAIYCDPILTNDTIYYAVGRGLVYAIDTETGEVRWKLCPLPDSELYADFVTDGERLFITSRPREEGKGVSALVAIGPK